MQSFKVKPQACWTLSHLFKDLENINFSFLEKEVLDQVFVYFIKVKQLVSPLAYMKAPLLFVRYCVYPASQAFHPHSY